MESCAELSMRRRHARSRRRAGQAVPWRAAECLRACTVHLGDRMEEIAASESAAWRGEIAERPFVLLAQPSLFDPSRAPAGKHTLWAYCHTPNGSAHSMTERIENQIERFAPGFRDRVLARRVTPPAELERLERSSLQTAVRLQRSTRPILAF